MPAGVAFAAIFWSPHLTDTSRGRECGAACALCNRRRPGHSAAGIDRRQPEVTLFSYLLILDIAVLVLAALRPWSRLLFAAFTGTVIVIAGGGSLSTRRRRKAAPHSFLPAFYSFSPLLLDLFGQSCARNLLGMGRAGFDCFASCECSSRISGVLFLVPRPHRTGQAHGSRLRSPRSLLLMRLPAQGMLRASPPALSDCIWPQPLCFSPSPFC